MDKQQAIYFEALTVNRSEGAKALEGFALRGVKNSVVEKYSDQAHFIYELLQNADDAKATSARFELFSDRLIFAHNGTRHFFVSNPATESEDLESNNLGDINAITAVGGSNKTDEVTIGKFGVGFKAVFQYTATPHIYDPNIFFKIERFIVPIRLAIDYPSRRNGETLFVFPFDHGTRSARDAYSDVFEKLRSLDFPLLFLSNLQDISFEISGTLGLYGKTIEKKRDFDGTTAEFIRLTQNDGKNREDLYDNMLWLFSRNDGGNHTYAVGYFVDSEGYLISKTHSAFCFFPTKEVTGLNFIIHAPFLLNDSREGIRAGVQHNIDMISLLSELAADSLVYLRDLGQLEPVPLIDDNIFDIIPYDESGFGDVSSKKLISFKPFYSAIKDAFESKAIIPALNDTYVLSSNAYWGGSDNNQLAEVFSNEQLACLTKDHDAKWAFASLSTPRSAGRSIKFDYIKSVIKNTVNDSTVINLIDKPFIESQKIDWLHRLYKYISTSDDRTKRVKTKPIFLDLEEKAVAAYDVKNQEILFLPIDGGSGYPTINETLLQNEDTLEFIKRLGISKPSLHDEIYHMIFPQYKDGGALDTNPHFLKFFRYYKDCSQSAQQKFINEIKDYSFIRYKAASDEHVYRGKGNDLYFPNQTLLKYFSVKQETKFVLLDEYKALIKDDDEGLLDDFLIALGVANLPRIIESKLTWQVAFTIKPYWENSNSYSNWAEREIDGCQAFIAHIIETSDEESSLFLWKLLLEIIKNRCFCHQEFNRIFFGTYENRVDGRYSPSYDSFFSRMSVCLRTKSWLLNTSGDYVSADGLSIQLLSPIYDISIDDAADFLRVLGIDTTTENDNDESDLTAEQQRKIEIANKIEAAGVTDEELDIILRKRQLEKQRINTVHEEGKEYVDEDDEGDVEGVSPINPSIKRVAKEISKRASSTPKEQHAKQEDTSNDTPTDEDDYTKPTIDISKKIEKVKEQAEHEIQEIARLEDLKQQAQEADTYSFGWFKVLLELESMNSGENNANSREISISFAKVEREAGTSRILILKHPSRYVPQSMEDLADIPLELHFASQPMVKVAVEVVNVKSYILRAKLRTNAQIDDIDLSLVTEARIVARNPIFLIEELRKAFTRLGDDNGYDDDFDMQDNLCENIEFVFGPPGTGKTTHVSKDIILPMMKSSDDLKVLVLTPTNKSADVLVRRLMESMDTDQSYMNWLVRFGATNDADIEKSGVFRDKTFDIRTFPRNVTVTTIARFPYDYFLPDASTRLHLSALKWDYIIIDEASMIPIANIIYPLYKKTPKKFIIAGDPFQIEPITTVDAWKNENIYTMVELKSFTEPTTVPHQYHVELLTTQYRSIPEIGEVFSRFAYGGVLKHFRTAESQRPLPIGDFINIKPLNIIKFPVSKFESIYRPKRLQSKTPYQVYSALFAFEFVKYISSLIGQAEGSEKFRIGLIAPYRAQADLIDKLTTSIILPKNIDVQVGTIHGFQGDECDIIIALFNPPPTITTHKDMFLNKLNIVNVSISRARDYLIVLMPDDETENIKNLTLIKKVECLCKEQPIWSEHLCSTVEDIMFGSKTYIEENSFSTSHQLVNVYGKPETRYEVRSEDSAVDVQIHD